MGIFLSSCSEEEAIDSPKENLLTGKVWQLSGGVVDPSFQGRDDYLSILKDCQLDDEWEFSGDSLWQIVVNTPCNSSEPAFINGSWDLTASSTRLILSNDLGEFFNYEVETLSEDSLIVTRRDDFGSNESFVITEIWTAK